MGLLWSDPPVDCSYQCLLEETSWWHSSLGGNKGLLLDFALMNTTSSAFLWFLLLARAFGGHFQQWEFIRTVASEGLWHFSCLTWCLPLSEADNSVFPAPLADGKSQGPAEPSCSYTVLDWYVREPGLYCTGGVLLLPLLLSVQRGKLTLSRKSLAGNF